MVVFAVTMTITTPVVPKDTLEQFLQWATSAAESLARLHQSGIIHKNIRPDTLRINPYGVEIFRTTGEQAPDFLPLKLPIEALPYIAPEQTGRFEEALDRRADLYSLGVVLYERWAKALPFHADDALGWVHCHIARAPRPLTEALPGTPPTLSNIIMRLLAKSPDERYQSARGLAFDLERCLSELSSKGHIEPFVLGTRDVWDKLRGATHAYGRDKEVAILREAAARVSTTHAVETVLILGPSGIGKTVLVRELQKSAAERVFFLAGKFEPHKREIPYGTIGQAFGDLVRQLLALPDTELDAIRQRLETALGVNVQLIVDLIPQLQLVMGKRPPVVPLAAAEAKSRFNLTFASFLGVLATDDRPIHLFLDDLQWADLGSIDLLQHILTQPGIRNVLVLGAYRDDEVDAFHPLTAMLAATEGAGAKVTRIPVGPLAKIHLVELVVDLFGCERSEAEPLAALLWTKTRGNPFFVSQLLGLLHERKLIRFEMRQWAWRWTITDIEDKEISNDLVDLVLGKLRRLPEKTLELLKIAACTGIEFTIDLISTLSGATAEQIRLDLEPAYADGILLQRRNGYKFLHDKLVHAVYSIIPENERTALHFKIGWLLLEQTPDTELEAVIFNVANQLNLGATRVETIEQRCQIAKLDLRAGKKAKASGAASTAAMFISIGISLLPEGGWDTDYTLAYDLHLQLAECEFLSGRFQESSNLCALIEKNARSLVDRASAYYLKIQLAMAQMNSGVAIELGRTCLSMLSIELPQEPSQADFAAEVDWIRQNLASRRIESLAELPEMTNPEMLAAVAVLSAMHPPTAFVSPVLNQVVIARMVRLSILYGNTSASGYGYALLGQLLCSKLGAFEEGYRFGRLAWELGQRPAFSAYNAEALVTFGTIAPFTRPLGEALDVLRAAVRVGRDTGKLSFTTASLIQVVVTMLAKGEHLETVHAASKTSHEAAIAAKFTFLADQAVGFQRVEQSLRGETDKFGSLCGGDFEEKAFEAHLETRSLPAVRFHYYIYKLAVRFLAHDYAEADKAASIAFELIWSRLYTLAEVELFFFAALTALALLENAGEEERVRLRSRLSACEGELRVLREHCPENFLGRHALVLAETARIEGRDAEAVPLYDEAIRASRAAGAVQLEGIACELASRFFLQRKFAVLPGAYLREARSCYSRWGAFGKVRQLDELYPELLAEARQASTMAESADAVPIDTLTANKASEAISSEMPPEQLLATLMRILAEHAGAQRAYLLLPTAAGLNTAAEISADHEGVRVETGRGRRSPSPNELPLSIANYVRRTREKLVLDDAKAEQIFSADPYIATFRPKSLLCVPILRRGGVAGILYLENRLARGAFTPRRMALLEFLSAISLENALLAADLVRETEVRTQAEKTLRQSEERLQRLVETANVVPWEADRKTAQFTYVGPQVVKMLGYPQEAWLAENFLATHVHPEDRDSTLRHIIASSEDDNFDFRMMAADGRTVWLHNFVSLREIDGTDIVGGFLFNVTERKEAEVNLKDKLRIIEEQQSAIQKLSTPIIEVWEGVLTVPILGVVDEQRAEQLMYTLLESVSRTACNYTIIDLTGVDAVDTRTASHLMKIVRAVQLLGAQSIVVGIRPEVAQTIVALGADLSSIVTLATLRQALLMCMNDPQAQRTRLRGPAKRQ